ncbi:hypothetical protein EJB05_50199, partial [Eragrostis curvula]
MYIIENKGGAIALILLSILFGGSFSPAMLYMERRGRLPQHIYLDYSIANVLVAVMIALTLGQIGESKPGMSNFFTQLSQVQDNWPSVLFAVAGGIALSLGNMISQYAWAFVGLSLANIIGCCMTVVFGALMHGTTVNYFLDGRINRAEVLFPGVACFVVAVLLGAAVNSSNAKDKEEKLRILGGDFITDEDIEMSRDDISAKASPRNGDHEDENASNQAKPGTAAFIARVEKTRSIKVAGSSSFIGLAIVLFAGVCFFIVSPAVNLASNDQLHVLKKGVPHLVVYTAFFYFYLSGFVLAICINFMGGQAAGFATADAVMASPLVCTFWDIVIFCEYRRSSRKTYLLLASMLTMFVIAIGVLLASAGHRKQT